MKTNAPEKVWVTDGWARQFNDKDFMGEDSIEYIRKDAFIEKACEWIKENLLNHTYVYEGEVGIGMAVFLEEFKRAMKK